MEIKLDSLINENRGEIRINISVENHPDELWRRFASVDMPRLIPHNGRAGHKCVSFPSCAVWLRILEIML